MFFKIKLLHIVKSLFIFYNKRINKLTSLLYKLNLLSFRKDVLLVLIYYFIAIGIIIIDQFTKYLTVSNIELGQIVDFIPGLLSFTYVQNTGAAWSILEGRMIFFYIVTIIVVGLLIYFLHHDAKGSRLLSLAIAMMIGGAIGNFIDRLLYQYVIDMVRLEFISFPIFNVADMALTLGVGLMLIGVIYEEFIKNKQNKEV